MFSLILYIDPGTGSALFSILIGVFITLYFLSKTIFIKVKQFISSGKVDHSITYKNDCVIYNEGNQYWNLFRPILEEFESRKISLLYLTSSIDDPAFDYNFAYIKITFIGDGSKAFARLNILQAGICLMTTPGLNVYQLKRSKLTNHYSFLHHSPTDASLYKLFSFDYFDSILLTGEYQATAIRELEILRNLPSKKLITVGCTYLDELDKMNSPINVNDIIKDNHYTVLISPSWGHSGLLSKFGTKLIDPLLESNNNIIIRPHPQSKISEKTLLNKLESIYLNSNKIVWDYNNDNYDSMSKADIMISDFSGIIFDYFFLFNKPVIYSIENFDKRQYDCDDLDSKLWCFETLKLAGISLLEKDLPNINSIIRKAFLNSNLLLSRKTARETAWQHRGKAAINVVDFMINTLKEIKKV